MIYTDAEARAALRADKRAMPNGTERPGEHWNARLLREEAIRADIAWQFFPETVKTLDGYQGRILRPQIIALTKNGDPCLYSGCNDPDTWLRDPYQLEIHGIEEWIFVCEDHLQLISDEI